MSRFALLGIALGFLGAASGCLDEHLQRDSASTRNKPVETPEMPEASVAVAARVDQIGRELIAANPFLGVDPVFHTIGIPQPMIMHPDLHGVMVSEGLVKKCNSDAELAAVLASELGQMAAEKKTASQLRLPERPPPVPTITGGNMMANGIDSDQVQLAELARFEKKYRDPTAKAERIADGRDVAAEVLQAAGYSPKELKTVDPLLRAAEKNRTLAPGFNKQSPPPQWSP